MRILILTGGESSCSDPAVSLLEESFSAEGWEWECRRSADFFSCCMSYLLARRLRWLEKHPRTCRYRGLPRKMLTRSARELRLYLEQEQFDAIVCTKVLSGLLLTEALRQHPIAAKTCLLTMGDTCPPGTELCQVDSFVLSHECLIPLFTARGIPPEKLVLCRQSPTGV